MLGWLVLVLAIGGAAAMPGTIYRCEGRDGETLFSDRPCPGGRVEPNPAVVTFDMSRLSAEEQAALDRLSDVARQPAAQPPRSANSARVMQAERRCEAARDGLDRVRAIKRRGYRASSAATLDARERNYEAQRDRNCAHPY
jgi:hypothetical protein